MEKYDSYKDSGIKWLGKIPSHWNTLPGMAVYEENKVKNSDLSVNTILSLSYGKIVIKKDINEGLVPAEYNTYQIVEPGYTIIRCTDLQNDKISLRTGFVRDKGIITGAYLGLKPKKVINPAYLHYFLHTWDITKEIYRYGSGLRQSLSWVDLKRLNILLPSIIEQEAIVNYLDAATSKIDSAIAQQQKMIDLLNERKQIIINNTVTKGLDPNVKMKASGADWIGDIPAHWEIYRIRYNYYLKGRIGWQGLKADEFIDAGPYLVTGTDFVNGKVNWQSCYHISKARFEEAPEIHVKKGDLLITKDGTVGKTAYIDEIPGPTSLNSHLLIVRPLHDKCNNIFLQYLIKSCIFISFMNIYQTGSIMASISQEKFSDFRFPLPPKQEQDIIIKFLNKIISKVDQTIDSILKHISLLQERKQIIINDVVTGKVKVV